MKITIRIPNISWRGGRPRFNPGPKLRALGYKGEDLRRANGGWMTLDEAREWTQRRQSDIIARRAQKASGARLKPIQSAKAAPSSSYTLEALFEDLWRSKSFAANAPKTRLDYRNKAANFASFDPLLWSVPARDLTRAAVLGLYERLWSEKGLAMANGMIAVLRLAYSAAIDRGRDGMTLNPCVKLRLKTPAPRLRCASPEEIAALMRAADALEPSIADAIVIALFTGQRQGDVLALSEIGAAEGRVRLRQNKTGARVSIRALPALTARLAAIAARNKEHGRVTPTIVAHPRTGQAWNEHAFRHRFAETRARAIEDGCDTLADFHFADLRDTAVTWLHRAGCTIPEIGSVTGHSERTIYTILKHYLVIDETTNDAAMAKLGAWMSEKGVRV